MRYSQSKSDINYPQYEQNVRNTVRANQEKSRKLLEGIDDTSFLKEHFEEYQKSLDFTGSLVLNNEPKHPKLTAFFLGQRPSRILREGDTYVTRWPDYLLALNPHFRSKQKIDHCIKMYQDSVETINSIVYNQLAQEDELWYNALLDYAKNAILTLFNTLMVIEKQNKIIKGKEEIHQTVREILIQKMKYAIQSYYGQLLDTKAYNEWTYESIVFSEEEKQMVQSYFCESMVSRSLSRPEATHPLTILSSCWLARQDNADVDTIVTMPAWSTEIWFLLQYLYTITNPDKKEPHLLQLPVSLHSTQDKGWQNDTVYQNFLQIIKEQIPWKSKVLIADDNSSTWSTVTTMENLIYQWSSWTKTSTFVTEVDLIRVLRWQDDLNRKHVASEELFCYSTNILPVAQTKKMKDLKKEKELARLASYYMDVSNQETDSIKKIMYTLYADIINDPTKYHISPEINFKDEESIKQEQEKNNTIIRFRGTFLSNFYPCIVSYKWMEYASVEHAYQAAKFDDDVNVYLSDEQRIKINEILTKKLSEPSARFGKRTQAVVLDTNDKIFTHPLLDAGDIKSIIDAIYDNKLFESVRLNVVKDRDDKKLWIMIDLLLQKFAHEPLKTLLLGTQQKYLIEWNSRGDQYRWWSKGKTNEIEKWDNYLWRCIMHIRKNIGT